MDGRSLSSIAVTWFDRTHLGRARDLVVAELARLRDLAPISPNMMADVVDARLDWLFGTCPGVAAVRDGKLVGFLGWLTIDDFRSTQRRGTCCPVWAHGAIAEDRELIYYQLYRVASEYWSDAGSHAHAITLSVYDTHAANALFWNGFGITVVDAVRAINERGTGGGAVLHPVPSGIAVRRAALSDLEGLVALESEHWRHYTQPPVLMPEQGPDSDDISTILTDGIASYWLTETADQPIGFLRFEPVAPGAADVLYSDTTIAINGAFVHPSWRGQGIATALLDTALDSYHQAGFTHCSVEFESFNPEARTYWPRTFHPVCLSVVRHPELTTTVKR